MAIRVVVDNFNVDWWVCWENFVVIDARTRLCIGIGFGGDDWSRFADLQESSLLVFVYVLKKEGGLGVHSRFSSQISDWVLRMTQKRCQINAY